MENYFKERPKVIYKYYPPTEYSLDALLNHYFWFSKRELLNDPFDLGNFSKGRTIFNMRQFVIKSIINRLGLDINEQLLSSLLPQYASCSFSRDLFNKQMWAYYAKDYHGWCLEFEVGKLNTKNDAPLLPAIYVDNNFQLLNPSIDNSLYGSKAIEQLIRQVLCTKHESWQHEEEERIVLEMKKQGNGDARKWGTYKLLSITMGNKIAAPHRNILTYIANQLENVPLNEIKLSKKDFELTI